MLRLDNQRLKREIDQIEKVVSERIGYLERYKTMAKFKLGLYLLDVFLLGNK